MKNYSNPSRKPMMYGGMAKPTKKMVGGGRTVSDRDYEATAKALGKDGKPVLSAELRQKIIKALSEPMTAEDKKLLRKYNSMMPADLKKKADKVMSTTDASTAKSYTPNDKKMYGGKAKKMAMGGKPMAKDPKTGKMMPTYAMDGKGKMMAGGKARKK